MKRTFIAHIVHISDQLKEQIGEIKHNVKGLNMKWVELNNLHFTLAFLGDTMPEQISNVKEKLGVLTMKYPPFNIRLSHLGVFRNLRDPQVLWLGIEANKTLETIYYDVQKLIKDQGFKSESRPFSPHLTLGRVKNYLPYHNLQDVITQHGSAIHELTPVSTVVYFESILSSSGAVYNPIQTYQLQGA